MFLLNQLILIFQLPSENKAIPKTKAIKEIKNVVDEVRQSSKELHVIVNEFGESTLTVNKSVENISRGANKRWNCKK